MGLSVFLGEDFTPPILTCDTCGEPIQNIRMAMVGRNYTSGHNTAPLYVFHKVKCDTGRKEYNLDEEIFR